MACVLILKPRRFSDDRGWFTETYSRRAATAAGVGQEFVQDNHSLSRSPGTIRGLHFQTTPHAQAKLVRCIAGRILDYAVDVRKGSPTWGRWVSTELTAANGHQLFIPVGFAHAFVTLEPDCEVAYKTTDYYAPECDGGIRFDDPMLGIPWPLPGISPVMSQKDEGLPLLSAFDSPFSYDGEPLSPSLD